MRGIDFSLYHSSYRDFRIKSKQSVLFIIIFTFFQSCGCGGIHIYCGNLLKQSPLYICEKHSNNERQMLDHIGKYSLHLMLIRICNTTMEASGIYNIHFNWYLQKVLNGPIHTRDQMMTFPMRMAVIQTQDHLHLSHEEMWCEKRRHLFYQIQSLPGKEMKIFGK